MSLSASRLRFRDASTVRSAELYTAAADWANLGTPSPKTLRVVNSGGTTLYVCLDSTKLVKHRDLFGKQRALKVCPGHDSVFTNGDFETSPLTGWTASSAGFAISRSTSKVLFGLASGVLHKATSKETGAYIDHAFTIASGDRDGQLYVTFDFRTEKDYIGGLFQVQVLKAAQVVAQAAIAKTHGQVRLNWTGDGTATYTLRFRVNADADDSRPLDAVREIVVDNIYAGPLLVYNVARKLLVMKDDTADSLEDRVIAFDVDDSGSPNIEPDTDQSIYEKEINFDYDCEFNVALPGGGSSPGNLFASGGMSGLNNGVEVFIDGASQGESATIRRLSGKHTIKLVAHNRSAFFRHSASYRVQAMTQLEVTT